ncbi:MAG: hypothetical protein Fur0043_12150 [Anaerolineales bacterium]
MKKPTLFIIPFFLSASLACALVSNLPGLSSPSGGGAQPADILFQDDFSDPSSGWDQYSDSGGSTDYDNGAYRIRVNNSQYSYWANPGQGSLPGDVHIEVDATKAGGPDANDFGVICRYHEEGGTANFYQFIATSDGFVGIVLVTENSQTVLSKDNLLQPHNAVKQGTATNHLTAECIGNTLTLYVNGVQVDRVTDSTLTDGDVGLIVGTYEEGGVDVLFDNFVVTRPSSP